MTLLFAKRYIEWLKGTMYATLTLGSASYAHGHPQLESGVKDSSGMKSASHAKHRGPQIVERIAFLTPLQAKLLKTTDSAERLAILESLAEVKEFLHTHPLIDQFITQANPAHAYALKAVIAVGQGPIVLNLPEQSESYFSQLQNLAQLLVPIETFYDTIGGIVGYHLTVLRLIQGEDLGPFRETSGVRYSKPQHTDLRETNAHVFGSIRTALEAFPSYAEVYVVGGAGDRLDLRDSETGEPLPAARLRFQGRTLLEGLVRDLQGREYLHYKLFGKQVHTPIAMMTSDEKNNHQHILDICHSDNWFGRSEKSFFLFSQPGTPVVTEGGDWSLKGPLSLNLKPGGHGMLWKLAEDHGVFDWLAQNGRTKLLIRQINNPVADSDLGILAFVGVGIAGNKGFGMASCDRLVNRPEGMSVLIETHANNAFEYRLSNIEYTELNKRGIKDLPITGTSECSIFPANTNILFADVETVRKTVQENPLPGLLINMKTKAPFLNTDWSTTQVPAGRLETTMQNIADYIVDTFTVPLAPEDQERLRTFATYNIRRKTLSVTKCCWQKGQSIVGTPEGCFYDLQSNYHELLQDHCHFKMPKLPKGEEFVEGAPPFILELHPALGPLYSVIAQKLRGGTLKKGAELRLEIADVDIEGLNLTGSLSIRADNVCGHREPSGLCTYSERTGKCSLHGVTVRNKGIDTAHSGPYWRKDIRHLEALTIILHGNGEFHAQNITFLGDHKIEVADGERIVATAGANGQIVITKTRISNPTWHWTYEFGDDDQIVLERRS